MKNINSHYLHSSNCYFWFNKFLKVELKKQNNVFLSGLVNLSNRYRMELYSEEGLLIYFSLQQDHEANLVIHGSELSDEGVIFGRANLHVRLHHQGLSHKLCSRVLFAPLKAGICCH
jgi:hypothetical protein